MRSTRHFVVRSALLLGAMILSSSCDVLDLAVGPTERRSELERQRAKWAQRNVTSYRLTYRRDCLCGTEFTTPTDIEVRAGDIATASYTNRDEPIPGYVQAGLPTVEALFAIIDDAIDRNADLIEVTYDPLLGYPRKIGLDYRFDRADDEVTHSILEFAIVLPPPVS
jgi:hypothetical protein